MAIEPGEMSAWWSQTELNCASCLWEYRPSRPHPIICKLNNLMMDKHWHRKSATDHIIESWVSMSNFWTYLIPGSSNYQDDLSFQVNRMVPPPTTAPPRLHPKDSSTLLGRSNSDMATGATPKRGRADQTLSQQNCSDGRGGASYTLGRSARAAAGVHCRTQELWRPGSSSVS